MTPTGPAGTHTYQISDDARWAIHGFSSRERAPVTEVVSLPDHEVLRVLVDNAELQATVDALGEYLSPGAPIVPLERLDPIYADFTLPERELARISEGQGIEVHVQAWPGQRFDGEIVAIDPGIQVGSRSFRVRGQLANPTQRLRPGMFADVRVSLPADEQVITIPDTAISYAPYGDTVFVIEGKDGQTTVSRRQIETGKSRAGRVAVAVPRAIRRRSQELLHRTP